MKSDNFTQPVDTTVANTHQPGQNDVRLSLNTVNKAIVRMKDNALAQLSDLDFQIKQEKYCNVPGFAIVRRRFDDRSANGLTGCIITWLLLRGHYATRVTTTGRKLKDTTITNVIGQARVIPGQWIPGTTRNGTSDIIACIAGKHYSIEVKIGRDKMSEAQRKTKDEVERAGGFYFVAKDFESFLKFYNQQIAVTI